MSLPKVSLPKAPIPKRTPSVVARPTGRSETGVTTTGRSETGRTTTGVTGRTETGVTTTGRAPRVPASTSSSMELPRAPIPKPKGVGATGVSTGVSAGVGMKPAGINPSLVKPTVIKPAAMKPREWQEIPPPVLSFSAEPESEDVVLSYGDYIGDRNQRSAVGLVDAINPTEEEMRAAAPLKMVDRTIYQAIFNRIRVTDFDVYIVNSPLADFILGWVDSSRVRTIYVVEPNLEKRKRIEQILDLYSVDLVDRVQFLNELRLAERGGNVVIFNNVPIPENWFEANTEALMVIHRSPPGLVSSIPNEEVWSTFDSAVPDDNIIFYMSTLGNQLAEKELPKFGIDPRWQQKVVSVVTGILENLNIPEPILDAMLAKSEWEKMFTHDSFDPSFNYETLETIGDVAMKMGFVDYLRTVYPNITDGQISALNQVYLSRDKQAEFARQFGFDVRGLIRLDNYPLTPSILEDVLESLFGAIFTTAQAAKSRGVAYQLVYNLIVYIFERNPVDLEATMRMAGGATTRLKEIYDKFGYKESPPTEWDGYTFSVFVPNIVRDKAREYRINLPTILGSARGSSRENAMKAAFDQAYARIQSFGITSELADRIKLDREYNLPGIKEYIRDAKQKARRDGFDRIEFKTFPNLKGQAQLLGYRKDGTVEKLITGFGNTDTDAKSNAISQYVALR